MKNEYKGIRFLHENYQKQAYGVVSSSIPYNDTTACMN